jgi:hypothetical protein
LSSNVHRPSVFTPFLRRFTDEPAREISETIALYREVRRAHHASPWAEPDIVERVSQRCAGVVVEAIEVPGYVPLREAFDRCLKALVALETTIISFPEIDWSRARLSMKEQVDLRRFLRAKQHFLANQDRVWDLLSSALCYVIGGIIEELPPIAEDNDPTLTVPLVSILRKPGETIDKIIGTLTTEPLVNAGLFTALDGRFYENQCRVSGVQPYAESKRPLVFADEAELSPEDLVESYLGGTPFADLFKTPVPFVLPQQTRYEHQWIVGGSGHGKTNALLGLILDDLELVAQGEASVVVMDSQSSLIPTLARLPFFAKGEPLEGKLVLIDVTDVEYPVALNLFDTGLQRLDRYSMLDRERMLNTSSEVMNYILSALLGAEMTSRQSTLFEFVLEAIQIIPNATVHTLRELMEPNGRKKFAPYLAKLTGRARDFFETQFDASIYAQTKQQVVARLYAICKNRTFDRMFSNPKSKLDLFTEINAGKVILINTAKDLLRQQGTEIFGRFFLALIAQAAQERATIHPSKRLPCFVYVDECHDYLETDTNFTMILEQARKQNVGLIVAHQYLSQLSLDTLDCLYANTSIKFAGGVSDKDAYALARNMRCEPPFIVEQPKGSFAGYVRNLTDKAITLKFPLLRLGKRSRMDDGEYARVLNDIRTRYAVHYTHLLEPPPSALPPSKPPVGKAATDQDATAAAERTEEVAAAEEAKPDPPEGPPKRKKWPM